MPKGLNRNPALYNISVNLDTAQAKARAIALQQQLNSLAQTSSSVALGLNAEDIQKISKATVELNAHLRQATNFNTGSLDFTKLDTSIRSSGQSLEAYGKQLLQLGPQGKQAFQQLATSVAQSEVPVRRLTGMLGEVGIALKNSIRWQLSSSLIHGFMGSVQQAFNYAQNLNRSLNNIQIVTGQSNEQMAKFAETANKAAKALSSTTVSYTDAALIYYQQGIRDQKEIEARTNATIKMANVTGQSAAKVSDQMTAIWNNFAKGSTNLEYYADVITALGAATASSSEEISRGLEKFAAIADTVGLSYENATAALATITATTRNSADSVGTGLRTLFSRLQSVSLGDTLEDGVNLTKYSQALETVGVKILQANGELRTMDDILEDLGKRWDKISDAQKVALAQTVGGVRQYTTLMALMDNFDFYKENQQIALSSAGTLEKQQEIFEQSWAAAQKQVRASMETLYSELIDDKFFIKLNKGFAGVINNLTNVIKGSGGMGGVLSLLGSGALRLFRDEAARGLVNFGTNVGSFFTSTKTYNQRRDQAITSMTSQLLDLNGRKPETLTGNDKLAYEYTKNQLEMQRTFAERSALMTPFQKSVAQQFLTNAEQAYNNWQASISTEQLLNVATSEARGSIVDALKNSQIYNDRRNAASTLQSKLNANNGGVISLTAKEKELANYLGLDVTRTQKGRQANFTLQGISSDYNFTTKFQEKFFGDFRNTIDKNLVTPLQNVTKQELAIQEARKSYDISADNQKNLQKALENAGMKNAEDFLSRNNLIINSKEDYDGVIKQLYENYGTNREQAIKSLEEYFGNVDENKLNDYLNKVRNKTVTEEDTKRFYKDMTNAQNAGKEAVNPQERAMSVAQNVVKTGQALMALNGVMANTGGLIDTVDQIHSGAIKASDSIGNLLGGFAGLAFNGGLAYTSLMPLISAIPVIGQAAPILAGLFTALPAIYKLVDRFIPKTETIEERAARYEEEYNTVSNLATQTENRYNTLLNNINNYQQLQEELASQASGTQEYRKTVLENNKVAKNIIEEGNLNYGSDWIVTKSGNIQFLNNADQKALIETLNQSEYLEKAKNGSDIIKTMFDLEVKKDEYDEFKNNIGQIFYNGNNEVIESYLEGTRNKTINTKIQSLFSDEQLEKLQDFYDNGDWTVEVFGQVSNGLIDYIFNVQRWMKELESQGISFSEYKKIAEDKYGQEIATTIFENFDNFYTQIYGQTYEEIITASTKASEAQKAALQTALPQAVASLAAQTNNQYGLINNMIIENLQTDFATLDSGTSLLDNEIERSVSSIDKNITNLKKFEDFTKEESQNSRDLLTTIYKQYTNSFPNSKWTYDELKTTVEGLITNAAAWQEFSRQQQNYIEEVGTSFNNYKQLTSSELKELVSNPDKQNSEIWQSVADNAMKEYQTAYYDLVSSALATGLTKDYSDIFANMGINDLQTYSSLVSNFNNILGQNAGIAVLSQINSAFGEQSNVAKSNLNALGRLTFTGDTILDIAMIKQNSKEFSDTFSEELMKAINEDVGGEKGLFEALYQSVNFSDVLDTLQDELEKTGKIGADSILKISQSSKVLSEYLDLSSTNAVGLGNAIAAIQKGTLKLSDISNELLEAFSTAGSVEAGLAESYSYIDNFDLSRSESDIGKFYQKLVKTITTSWAKGMWMDAPLLEAWEAILGTDSVENYKKKVIEFTNQGKSLAEVMDLMNKEFASEWEVFDSIKKYGDTRGIFKSFVNDENSLVTDNGVTLYTVNNDGSVTLDLDHLYENGIKTREDYIQSLIKKGISEAVANNMFSDVITRSGAAYNYFQLGGAEEARANLLGLNEEDKNKYRVVTEEQLRALYEENAEYYGNIGVDRFIANARRDAAAGTRIVGLSKFTEEGNLAALTNYLQKQFGVEGNQSIDDILKYGLGFKINGADLREKNNQRIEAFSALGIDEDRAWEYINQIEEVQKELEKVKKENNSDLIKYLAYRNKTLDTMDAQDYQGYLEQLQTGTQLNDYETTLTNIFKTAMVEPIVNQLSGIVETINKIATEGIPLTQTPASETPSDGEEEPDNPDNNSKESPSGVKIADVTVEGFTAEQQQGMARQIQEAYGSLPVTAQLIPDTNQIEIWIQDFESNPIVADIVANDDMLQNTVKSIEQTTSRLMHATQISSGQNGYNVSWTYPQAANSYGPFGLGDYLLAGFQFMQQQQQQQWIAQQRNVNKRLAARNMILEASGQNNIGQFASGKDKNSYEGIAETGELGPELWIHEGKPYLTGLHGRTKVYVHSDDQIWTAAQTREILRNNPGLQDIPGFDGGKFGSTTVFGSTSSGGGGSSGGSKEDEYEPERYHVITRQLAQLTQQYEELGKVKENAYGTNKLDAIQREIEMTNSLITAQRELIKEAEEYARKDRQEIVDLELDTKLEFDENGNITNWEDVETELGKKAKNGDKTAAENLQKLKQYEESVDKWNEAQQQLRDYIYQLSDLTLEKITTKVELVVDMDDREINFIDHFIDKLDDKVGDVAEILTLTGQKLEKINDQIEVTRNGLNDVIKLMRNDYGEALSEDQTNLLQNVIDNVGGQYNTAQEIFDALDPLHINESFGRQIESYVDDLLKYIEAMDKLKKEGIDKLDKAFDELNKNISDSMNLFSYYNDVLSKMKDITELQGTTLTKELRDLTKSLNQSILDNSLNNLKTERQNQARLQEAVRELQQQVENETDDSLRRAWEDELKKAEKELQDSTKSVLSLIQDSLEQAKTMFENALDGITEDYEKQISGMYGTTEELSNAFDRKKEIDDFYVDDYEKYYQIAKLQRSITGDIDKAARAGNKSNQGLKKLLNELNAAREDGVELTAYDLDVFAKRYEYEKALMELEDARNDKSEVRLQRDANGNWGYVYTSAADEDDLLAKQQAVDDKLYEWQKTVDNQADEIQSTILNTFSDIVSEANEMLKNGASQDAVQDYINDRIKALQLYSQQFGTSLSDALQTLDIAKDRYGKELFNMLDNYGDSILSSILGIPLEAIPGVITDVLAPSFDAANRYSELIKSIDTEGGYKDFISGITGARKEIDALSDQNRVETISAIGDATTQFTDIMNEAISYEDKFLAIYGIQIEQTERELGRLLDILDAVNRIEYDDGEGYKNKDSLDMSDITKTEKPSNGAGGYCDGCINTCEGGLNSTAGCHWSCSGNCGGNCGNSCGGNCVTGCSGTTRQKVRIGYNLDEQPGSIVVNSDRVSNVITTYDTGGYTGDWGTSNGKFAVLHEKEQVFNKDDTEKLLNAASILRTIDLQADIFGKGLTGISIPQLLGQTGQTTLDQNVHIEATFPNVTDHNEIEMAFDNLVNKASQYANRKNMSSMTFQDMYTSKF